MQIYWKASDEEIFRIKDFVRQNYNPFVEARISRNVNRQNLDIDRNSIIRAIFMCLLTSQQRSGPETLVGRFLNKKPFPFTYETFTKNDDIKAFVSFTLKQNGLNRYINNITSYFIANYNYLEKTKWQLVEYLFSELIGETTIPVERKIADYIDYTFVGFGPKQSRNFLQSLGLTRYEIPIDSRITDWLNRFGFPVTLSSIALQDKGYYHFVSDGIQKMCSDANIYPCVLDAAIFSSYDKGKWTPENLVY